MEVFSMCKLSEKSRWFVEISEDVYGATATQRVYIPCRSDVNHVKCLKKLWKHYDKMFYMMDNINVSAYVESEDGELCDMSQRWIYEEM